MNRMPADKYSANSHASMSVFVILSVTLFLMVLIGMIAASLSYSSYIYKNFLYTDILHVSNNNNEINIVLESNEKPLNEKLNYNNFDVIEVAQNFGRIKMLKNNFSKPETVFNDVLISDESFAVNGFYNTSDYNVPFTWFLLFVIIVIALIIIVFNIFVFRLHKNLRRTAEDIKIVQRNAKRERDINEEHIYWQQSILDSVPFPITAQDLNRRWVFLNKTAGNLIGKPRKELLGQSCNYWKTNICDTEKCSIECALRGEQETFSKGDNNSYRVDVKTLLSKVKERMGFVEIIYDITDIEKEQIKGTNRILSMMNHELRTPMNAIVGMTQLAKISETDEKTNYCLVKIEDASQHLLGVINDILDMSKIGTNQIELSQEVFNFREMIKRIINSLKFHIEEKGLTFNLHIEDKIPANLVGDPQRLSQVITHIVGNAVKFTFNGSVNLEVKLLEKNNDDCTLMITIEDTGIGITPDEQEELFKVFHQVERNTSRQFGGTGLGLAISKNIVEMMGGKIWVKSEFGKGSVFSFTFKIKATDKKEKEIKQIDSRGIFKGFNILVVEDVEVNAEIAVELLKLTEAEVDCAANGVEAVKMFQKSPGKYALILMDLNMPEMDGYEASRQIRKIESELESDQSAAVNLAEGEKQNCPHKQIPIIAMTANVFKEDIEKCKEAGMNDHIGKPLDFDNVILKLRSYIFPL